MNVCLLNHNVAWSGGTFVRCFALAKAMALKGHRPTLVTTSRSARWRVKASTFEGVAVVEYPAAASGRLRSGWDPVDTIGRIRAALAGDLGRPDVVHAFDSRPTVILPALVLSKHSGAPLVMDWADWWGRGGTIESRSTRRLTRFLVRAPETWFEEAFRRQANRTTVIGAALAARAHDLGVSKQSITVIPQGCDTDAIVPLTTAEARRRCGFPVSGPLVGYEGTILKEDAPMLLRLFQALRAADQRLRLLLIGNPGVTLPNIEGLDRVGFVPRSRLSDYLGACDMFLLPLTDSVANRGRWPSKINDYLSSGRPTVATPVGDLNWLFARHNVGMLGNYEDGTLAAACLQLLSDSDTRATMGHNARRLAETELSWDRICETLIDVYRDAIGEGQ